MNVKELIDSGYCRVSNSARIDREDWVEVLQNNRPTHNKKMFAQLKDYYNGADFTGTFSQISVEAEAEMRADTYRRSYSNDKISDVPLEIFRQIPASNWNKTGFCKQVA
jgi:hypothetical protein